MMCRCADVQMCRYADVLIKVNIEFLVDYLYDVDVEDMMLII